MGDLIALPSSGMIGDGIALPADQVLEQAKGKYRRAVLVGETPDGEIQVCGTAGSGDSALLLLWAINFLTNNIVARS
jgi:hypothetical protein